MVDKAPDALVNVFVDLLDLGLGEARASAGPFAAAERVFLLEQLAEIEGDGHQTREVKRGLLGHQLFHPVGQVALGGP